MFKQAKKKKELAEQGLITKNYAIKVAAYPNDNQVEKLCQTFGCVRLVYNEALDYRIEQYKLYDRFVSYAELEWRLTHFYKSSEEYAFLNDVDKFSLTSALRHLDEAYKNFFEKRAGFPKFKSKKKAKESYKTKITNNNIAVIIQDDQLFVKLPKLGLVKCSTDINNHNLQTLLASKSRILNATISHNNGNYYISIGVEEIIPIQTKPTTIKKENIIAGDLGIKTLVDLYDGKSHTQVPNMKWTYKNEKKTRRLHKAYSRKKKGSKNQAKAKKKLANHLNHVANQRKDFNHKLSRTIVNESQVYVSEDLAIKNMVKNHKLSKAILSCGWGQLMTFIKYKIEDKNGYFIKVDRFYPSSKTCGNCGYKNNELTLKIREWTCPRCSTYHDRDGNASENLHAEGIRILNSMGVTVI